MYILLQHFQKDSKACVKAFREINDIETYMRSELITELDIFDNYAGKSIIQRQLTKTPNYDGVIGFIFNDNSNGIIYNLDVEDDMNECFVVIKFDIDTCGNSAPWIKLFAQYYEGTDFMDSDNIINTNDLRSKYKYFNDHIVYLKFNL